MGLRLKFSRLLTRHSLDVASAGSQYRRYWRLSQAGRQLHSALTRYRRWNGRRAANAVQSGAATSHDLGHLERDGGRVEDDLRAIPNRRWAIAHEIGA